MLDFMNFMFKNKDLQEYVDPNMVNKATANRFMVSNEFGREFHSVRIIFSAVFNCNKFATINFRFCFISL